MKLFFKKLVRNLNRPIPNLYNYIHGKIISLVWKLYINTVGDNFNLSYGANIEGGNNIYIGTRFTAGNSLWLAAITNYLGSEYFPKITIGSNVSLSNSVHIAAINSITISDGVLIGSNVHITDHAHGSYVGEDQTSPYSLPTFRPLGSGGAIFIGKNVWIGDGVVVLPGVTIGEGCIVGANSVVSRSLRNHVIAVGAPAMPIKEFDDFSGSWITIETVS